MKGLPLWMLAIITGLATLLIVIGWSDRHEAGYLPFVMGIIFGLFLLVSLGARARATEDD
jgi:predicted membrane channel-forming protein YqfA (hemolysin III family)